jgi:hypothetical protein
MSQAQMPGAASTAPIGIKVSLGMLASSARRCPVHDAMAVRRDNSSAGSARRKPEALEDFSLGPFMTVLDLVEDGGVTVEEAFHELDRRIAGRRSRPVHEGVREWTEHTVATYLRVFGQRDTEATVPVLRKWEYRRHLTRPDERGAVDYTITAWGRCYVSPDRRTRELRLIKNRSGSGTRSDAEVSVAALVVAAGRPGPPPEHVRIVQIGLLDGAIETLFDDHVESAMSVYQTHGRRALSELVDQVEYRPGTACADCSFALRCPALPKTPGVLGIRDGDRPRRTWSPTNARQYRACAARDYLRRQWLPVDTTIEYGPPAERGRAVHAYLERRHTASPTVPCTKEVPSAWAAGRQLSEEDLALGMTLIRHHAEVCPLQHVRNSADVRIEPDLVFDDTDADIVVLAKPDLLYREDDGWVWRETKTAGSDRRKGQNPLVKYPQLALAVTLLGAGVLGGRRGRVELEVLRPGGPDLVTFDPFTAEVRAATDLAMADHVRAWYADDRFLPSPGPECARCEVARWCPSRISAPARVGSAEPRSPR